MSKSKYIILFFIFQIVGVFTFIFVGSYFDPEGADGLIHTREIHRPIWQYVIYYVQMLSYVLISIFILYLYRKKITHKWEYIILGIAILFMLFVFSMNLVWALVFVN
jgi:hypothetical protein